MAKKSKLKTPDWILQGFDSEEDYNKKALSSSGLSKVRNSGSSNSGLPKTLNSFKIKRCPKCGSDDVQVVIGDVGMWECKKCGWKGKDVKEEKLNEDEMMKYLSDTDSPKVPSDTDSPNGSDEKGEKEY